MGASLLGGLVAALVTAAGGSPAAVAEAGLGASPTQPDVVLVTLDTTRADSLGAYGGAASTPVLDALARRGLRYVRAMTAAPLTLPAHASLLTGLAPPQHGLRDNGAGALPAGIPSVAEAFAAAGYETAAFVASRILDRRFGLDRGFARYDDAMVAERIGEYGYPERDARAVTDAALGWLAARPAPRPLFLWVHYYDPHAPYAAPGIASEDSNRASYDGELAFADRQLGRLLAGLPRPAEATLVAVVGDHGESLGEHGERTHGVFLYRAVLEVPLLLAGPGVPAGRAVEEAVETSRLAATLVLLAGLDAGPWGEPLYGFGRDAGIETGIYSESLMPASTYGWSPLFALSRGPWRYVAAPRPELYDVLADPGEERNLAAERPEIAAALREDLARLAAGLGERAADPVALDAAMAAALASLGYLGGGSSGDASAIDPKDGIAWLEELEAAKRELAAGQAAPALAKFEGLVRRNPQNVPFLTNLGHAQARLGRSGEAVETFGRAAELRPALHFVHLNLGDALFQAGRLAEARAAYERVVAIDPRFPKAWLRLSDLELAADDPPAAREVLERAVAAGTESAVLLTHLAVLQRATGEPAAAASSVEAATHLLPDYAPAWLLRGELAEAAADRSAARAAYERAVAADPAHPGALLALGRWLVRHGDRELARPYLERILALEPASREAAQARQLLASAGSP